MDPDRIRNTVLATITAIAPETDMPSLRSDQPLRDQVDLDSMDWVNLVAGLEERLDVDIPPSDYARLTTLDSVVAYLATRPATAGGRRAPASEAERLHPTRHVVNGMQVTIRPIGAEDAARESEFVRRLSMDSRYGRFMVAMSELPQAKLKYLTEVDQVKHVALVATLDQGGREVLVGVARYIVDPSGTGCEFAAAVDDTWQGSGLAGILMNALIGIARARGLKTMEGIVLATNTRMLKFTRQLGFSAERDPDDHSTLRVARAL